MTAYNTYMRQDVLNMRAVACLANNMPDEDAGGAEAGRGGGRQPAGGSQVDCRGSLWLRRLLP